MLTSSGMENAMVTSRVHCGLGSLHISSRRQFLKSAVAAGSVLGVGDLAWLAPRSPVSAEASPRPPYATRLRPTIAPLVRLLEDTPRARLLEEVGRRVQQGLSYRALLAALLLAGVRNIQPRPVGFKFHAVLVVHSVHLAGRASPASDSWLPLFWALDYFKRAQARDVYEGDWIMGPVQESNVPPPHQAKRAFMQAMDQWDEAAADAAVVGLVRAVGAHDVFDIFCRYGARDYRAIGHKAIYLANGWRTLQTIGWQHAEPILRSLAYALLAHDGDNPARRDAVADQPFRRNRHLMDTIRSGWRVGETNAAATTEMLAVLRYASTDDACDTVVRLLNRGIAPQSLWDALFNAAAELLMRHPGILALHAVTSTNALHFAFQTTRDDATRRLLLLQNAAFIPLFRGYPDRRQHLNIDQLQPDKLTHSGAEAIEEIFATISHDSVDAARKVLAYMHGQHHPHAFLEAVRRLLWRKGDNAHDYKFGAAVLEDYYHVSPAWRDRYLAASVFNLPGSGSADHNLVERIRAALAG